MKMRNPMSTKGMNPFVFEGQPELTEADEKAFAKSLFQLVIRLYENKNYAQALRLMDYLIRAEGPSADYCRVAGFILQAENKCTQALAYFSEAQSLGFKADAQLNLSQAQCHLLLNDYVQAQKALELAAQCLKSESQNTHLAKTVASLLERVREINQASCPVTNRQK
jgi:predicted Zn-dependent protease